MILHVHGITTWQPRRRRDPSTNHPRPAPGVQRWHAGDLEGLPAEHMPAVDKPVAGTIGYHIRTGKHDVTEFDWSAYLDFADKHLRD